MEQQHDRLLERLFTSFKDCKDKVDQTMEFTEHRYNDTKRELFRVTSVAEAAVEKVRFAELQLEVKGLKSLFEREMDHMQDHCRKMLDKNAEVTLKFANLQQDFEDLKINGDMNARSFSTSSPFPVNKLRKQQTMFGRR